MAKRWDSFTAPFSQSHIPFLVAEIVADGQGEMVDLICRFANDAAAAVLNLSAGEMRGQRLTHCLPAREIDAFRSLQTVAFSGSTVSFPYTTVLGREVTITCYQLTYGAVGCILDPCPGAGSRLCAEGFSAEYLPEAAAVLELGRRGLRCLSLNRRLCALTGWTQKEFLDRFAEDLTRLLDPEDRSGLIQSLLDAVRSGPSPAFALRLLRQGGDSIWVELRAELVRSQDGISTFYAIFADIDQQRRTQARLTETLAQLQAAREQLSALFAYLPGGYCLLRQTSAGETIPQQISPGLATLVGCSVEDLKRQLAADPLSVVVPADRERLCAAIAQARALGASARHLCRLRVAETTPPIWVRLTAAMQPLDSGDRLFYIVCTDISHAQELESSLLFATQLCDLLLEHTPVLLLDYDPLSDAARIDLFTDSGRRVLRAEEHYLRSLESTPFIHPEDRRGLASAISRAVTQPVSEHPEYRGNYSGSGWRHYRVSWLRQIDGAGNVTRLVGKADDVTAAKASASRFSELHTAMRKLSPGVLALALLDLTENRILDAKAATRHLRSVLFGNTAEACLQQLRENIPTAPARETFDGLFSRDALLSFYQQGRTQLFSEQLFGRDKNRVVWASMEAVLIRHPESGHVAAFCTIRNTDEAHQADAVLQALAEEYDAVLTVDAAGGSRLFAPRNATLQSYRALAAEFLHTLPPSPQRATLRRASRLDAVLAALTEQSCYRLSCLQPSANGSRPTEVCWRFLNRDAKTLLVTLRRDSAGGV